MIGLIKKGRTAEIDTLFIFFVMFILLVWLNGYVRQWKPVLLWSIALSLVGLGFLAKGPQVIAYFYLTIFAYLLFRKRMSFFFSKEHLFGLLFFVLILGVYMFFVLQRISLERYIHMWINQIVDRAESKTSFSFIGHLHFVSVGRDTLFYAMDAHDHTRGYFQGIKEANQGIPQQRIVCLSLLS